MQHVRVRLRIRWMVTAVAIVAVLLSAVIFASRMTYLARAYQAQAKSLAESARYDLQVATTYDRQSAQAMAAGDQAGAKFLTDQATQARDYASQFAAWSAAYEAAAARPWTALPPGTIKLMTQPAPSSIDVVPYTLRSLGTVAGITVLTCVLCLILVAFRPKNRSDTNFG